MLTTWPYLLLIDLCLGLRHRYALRLGAWCCDRALARLEDPKGPEHYETFVAEARSTPLPAPVFEQLLLEEMDSPPPDPSETPPPS